MTYTFKRNKISGSYEVMKHNKIVKECNTKDEVCKYIGEHTEGKESQTDSSKKKKIIGFGDWVPSFMLKEGISKEKR